MLIYANSLVDKNFDLIIAKGGGSAIDVAKILSCFKPISQLTQFDPSIETLYKHTPLAAIPTTGGTGAEVTPFSTLWTNQGIGKISYSSPSLIPDSAVLDGANLLSLSIIQLTNSALDAMAHCVETLWNRNMNKESFDYSSAALESMLNVLPRIFSNNGSNTDFQILLESSFIAGKAIAINRTSITHSMSYPLTAYFGISHGPAVSYTIPSTWEFVKCKYNFSNASQNLIGRCASFISSLGIPEEMSKMISFDDLVGYIPLMIENERAQNFVLDIDETIIESILQSSLKPRM